MRTRLLLLLALAACGSEDDRPVTWAYIQAAIILPNCTTSGCHSALTQSGPSTGGLNFEDSRTACTTLRGLSTSTIDILRAGRKNGAGAALDYRMPPDQPLPDADIDLIERFLLSNDAAPPCPGDL